MEERKHIKVLTLHFASPIEAWEVPLFRGAVINTIGESVDMLFHNHAPEEEFRYSYPLIQYKRLHGNAAIVCLEEGVDKIGQFLSTNKTEIMLGERPLTLALDGVKPQNILIQTWKSDFPYHIHNWIPLNQENYRRYKATSSQIERITLLENILRGNILSMCKGLGIHVSEELKVHIGKVSEPRLVKVKGVKVMLFDADFYSNLSIPNNIGLGKNISFGFGITHLKKQENHEHNNNTNDELTVN